jgi:hypothetical protein
MPHALPATNLRRGRVPDALRRRLLRAHLPGRECLRPGGPLRPNLPTLTHEVVPTYASRLEYWSATTRRRQSAVALCCGLTGGGPAAGVRQRRKLRHH